MKLAPLLDEYSKKDPKDDWEVDCNRFVGFLDIMGFKDLVARKPHEDVKHVLLQMNQTRTILLKVLAEKAMPGNQKDSRIRSFSFSDSVVFVTKSNTARDLFLLGLALSICQESTIQSGVPTKGAISYGRLTADFSRSIFFGQPLIDAFLLQEQLYYYGIILDNNAEAIFRQYASTKGNDFDQSLFIQLPTPLKTAKVVHFNLRIGSLQQDQLDYLYNNVSGQPRKYVDNTIEIYEQMKSVEK